MRKILTFSLLLLSATVMLPACKKGKKFNNNYYVKFKINGTWVTWTNVLGEFGPDLADGSKTNLGITAQNDNNTEPRILPSRWMGGIQIHPERHLHHR